MGEGHLWQGLGLSDRGELNHLLARHFPVLRAGGVNNMRWKKFFYRRLCELEGFSLCVAPHRSVCANFASCFGDKGGMSRLAMVAREAPAHGMNCARLAPSGGRLSCSAARECRRRRSATAESR
jgi:nitrogen fixation protein NifQ